MKLLTTFLFFSLFFSVNTTEILAQEVQADDSIPDLTLFRYSYEDMVKLANPKQLKHRVFYTKLSEGPDATWFDAVKRGNTQAVIEMVQNGQDIEVTDEASLGQTALGWASFIGYEDIFDYLIDQGADIHATDRADVYNVFKSAVLGGNINIVKKAYALLQDETDINEQEDDGETITMVAASNGRLETVEFLLTLNPDLNIVSEKYDVTALSVACKRGFKDVVELLIKHGAINNKTGKSDCIELEM